MTCLTGPRVPGVRWETGLVDLGYQGLQKLDANAVIPFKRSKNKSLDDEQKKYNRLLASLRIRIEHVIRCCKIFRIVKGIYRGKHRHYSRTWHLIAGLVNFRYQQPS